MSLAFTINLCYNGELMSSNIYSHDNRPVYTSPEYAHLDVSAAFNTFNDHVRSEALTPQEDVARILRDFTDPYMPEATYDAARMCNLADCLNNDLLVKNVQRALTAYHGPSGGFTSEHNDQYEHVRLLMEGFPAVNEFIDNHFVQWGRANTPRRAKTIDAMNVALDTPIDKNTWLEDPIPPDLEALTRLLVKDEAGNGTEVAKVRLRTMLIKSAQALHKLSDDTLPEKELFRTIAAIESVYAPLCEITGFDAFAATLLDQTNQIRLQKAGRGDLVAKARDMLASFGDRRSLEAFISQLPEQLVGSSDHEAIIDESHTYANYFGRTYSHSSITRSDQLIQSVMRIKSVGSLARKLLHQETKGLSTDISPLDIVGMTIIIPDEDDVPAVFADIITHLNDTNGLSFEPAPSRYEALHIKGERSFIDRVRAAAANVSNKAIDECENDKGFEVAKATVLFPRYDESTKTTHQIPIEIQCTHKEARKEGRLGYDSHTLFKLRKYNREQPGNEEFLESERAAKCLVSINKLKKSLSRSTLEAETPSYAKARVSLGEQAVKTWLAMTHAGIQFGIQTTQIGLDALNRVYKRP